MAPAPRAVLLLVVLLAGCAAAPPPPAPRFPTSLAVVGDSISRGTNAEAPGERLADSWATGDASGLGSFAQRLDALEEGFPFATFNDAEGGASSADLAAQAERAIAQRAQVVVVLMGANDACEGTSAAQFRASFQAAANALHAANATVYVVSVPDLARVWDALHDDSHARALWRVTRACPALLRENSTAADRDLVRARVDAINAVLAQESARVAFATDGGAVHDAAFSSALLSSIDAFHPNAAGQRALAAVAWNASPWAMVH